MSNRFKQVGFLYDLWQEYLAKGGPPDSIQDFLDWASPLVDLGTGAATWEPEVPSWVYGD